MKIGKVINLKDYSFVIDFLNKNKVILLSLLLFISGFGFGIYSLDKFEGFKTFFESNLNDVISLRKKGDIFDISISSFGFYLNTLINIFIIGSSILGLVLLPFILFGYGMFYGSIISLLYITYDLKGVVLSGVLVIPLIVLFSICLIFAIKEATDFSLKISSLTFPKTAPTNLYFAFKSYCSKFLIIISISVISSLLDGFLSFYLFEKFNIWFLNRGGAIWKIILMVLECI